MTTNSNFDLIQCVRKAENDTDVISDPWQYISCYWGPQTQNLEIAIGVTVINCIIFVTGLLGNITVCIVISKHHSLNSPTDYYLLNLAIADVTLLIFGLPYDVSLFWHQYPWTLGTEICRTRALISETASNASVLTVVTFSTERYLAICHPLYKLAITSLQRARRIIVALWLVSFLCALPFAVNSDVHYVPYPENGTYTLPESAFCAMIYQPENVPLTEISSVIFFVIPMIVIIYQYIKMGIAIKQTTTNNNFAKGSVHKKRRRNHQSNKTIVKMLSFVVLGFFACWCPFHVQRLVSVYLNNYEFFDEMNYWMYITSGIFYYFSSTLNPILYNVMSDRMRNAFKEVICGIREKKRRSNWSRNTTKETSDVFISTQPMNPDEETVHLMRGGQWRSSIIGRYFDLERDSDNKGETDV